MARFALHESEVAWARWFAIRRTKFPFFNGCSSEEAPERKGLERWSRRMAWFWNAIALSSLQPANVWFTGFELRVRNDPEKINHPHDSYPLRAGLWAKTIAPNADLAVQTAGTTANMAHALLPVEFQPKVICTEKRFLELWGEYPPDWLGEIRPGMTAVPKVEGDRADAGGWELSFSPWLPGCEAMLEVWALLARLEEPVWFSLGICPTQLFEPEKTARKDFGANQPPDAGWNGHHFFQVRLRVGGSEKPARWLAQALASAFHQENHVPPVTLVPSTTAEAQNAAFNWAWGDFQPWAEIPLPVPL
jgi:hypothetical protein